MAKKLQLISPLKGERGERGETGPRGPSGEQGPQGPQGDPDVHIGKEEPTNLDTTIWIDTNESESTNYINAPATATVNQTIVVKEVDQDGKPVKWECADVGGGSEYTPAPLPLLADVTSEEALKVFEVALSKRAVKRVIMYITVSSEEPVGAPLYGYINGKVFDCMISGSTALEAGNTTWMELELMAGGLARFTTSTSRGDAWSQKPINTSGKMQNYAYVDSIGGCLMKSDVWIPAGTRIQVWGE